MRRTGMYPAVARYGFRRYATYRIVTLARVFTNTVFGCVLGSARLALWSERPTAAGGLVFVLALPEDPLVWAGFLRRDNSRGGRRWSGRCCR